MKNFLYLISIVILLFSCKNKDTPGTEKETEKGKTQGKVLFDGKVHTKTVTVGGDLQNNGFKYSVWKGITPNLIYYANPDNSVDIAWRDKSTGKIGFTTVDSEGNKVKEFMLSTPKTVSILGFTKIPKENNYVIAYSKAVTITYQKGNNVYEKPGKKITVGEYCMTKFDASGKKIFDRTVFKSEPQKKWGIFNPGSNSSGRLEYYKDRDMLIAFYGHNMRRGNASIHQASTFAAFNSDGTYIGSRGWFVSHDYDMKIRFDLGNTFLFGHGDNGPQGLYVAPFRFSRRLNKEKKKRLYVEKLIQPYVATVYARMSNKPRGFNATNMTAGGIAGLGNGEFAVVYTEGKFEGRSRGYYDVYFKRLDTKGGSISIYDPSKKKKLTDVGKNKEHGGCARVAKFGDDLIVAWHHDKNPDHAYIGQYDIDGNVVVEPKAMDNVLLNPMYELINLPNGNVFWASSEKGGGSNLHLYWIKKQTSK